jgi:ABC-type Na+ transport system ATPase subunit NatA
MDEITKNGIDFVNSIKGLTKDEIEEIISTQLEEMQKELQMNDEEKETYRDFLRKMASLSV